MTYDDLIAHFRTQTKVAEALCIEQASISLWKSRGKIPPVRQMHIQLVTGGLLCADPILSKTKNPSKTKRKARRK